MKNKSNQKNTEVITLLVRPSEKEEIKAVADYLGIGMNSLLKVAFKTYKSQLLTWPEFEPSERTIKALKAARSSTGISTNGRKASEVLKELVDDAN